MAFRGSEHSRRQWWKYAALIVLAAVTAVVVFLAMTGPGMDAPPRLDLK